ncbi:hypothetical protein BS333_19965 [Vibrio azureus]|uniref:Uncharacterized protein n=2 Tax=Vibrio azureus TaxID=512649 RepID=U3C3K4_9VIBR|nr:hypothetical protein [Vibrio azureus]AUI88582.1 hypothetical protein BS333_19965 [Vibrio azureus]GAD76024.1 hypothetical protein VAZ01S_035_00320 [Vibrio azureus NBRC 104587]
MKTVRLFLFIISFFIVSVAGASTYSQESHDTSKTTWLDGASLGVPLWYAVNNNGDIQCYSIDGKNCIWQPDYKQRTVMTDNKSLSKLSHNPEPLELLLSKHNQVNINIQTAEVIQSIILPDHVQQGAKVVVYLNSPYSLQIHFPNGQSQTLEQGNHSSWVFLGQGWYQEGTHISDYTNIMAVANPVMCGEPHKKVWGVTGYDSPRHWCSKLSNTDRLYLTKTLKAAIKDKHQKIKHLSKFIDSMPSKEPSYTTDYPKLLKELGEARDSKYQARALTCGLAWWNIPGIVACSVLSKQYDDLSEAYLALSAESQAHLHAMNEVNNLERSRGQQDFITAMTKKNIEHFRALLQEENQTVEELNALLAQNNKSLQKAHTDYQAAIKNYELESNFGHIVLNSLEAVPFLARELDHISAYSKQPSSKNLRKMLLGLTGPVGETLEGVIELETEDKPLNESKLDLIYRSLRHLTHDTIGQALQEVVSDTINNLGDEAIESLRQTGLWKVSENKRPIRDIASQSLVDLRAQLTPISYDFWQGDSVVESRAKEKFYLSPTARDATAINRYYNEVSALFRHAFGANYAQITKQNPKFASWTDRKVNKALLEVLQNPIYNNVRTPYWGSTELMGARPAAMIFNEQHAMIVLNRDLVTLQSEDFHKFYFEELGHLLNWWRCKLFELLPSYCQVIGDVGARFRDAVMLDPNLHDRSLESLLFALPMHTNNTQETLRFLNGQFATLEGWPNYYTINEHIAGQGRFSWLMRLGLDITNPEFAFLSDELDIEISITAPIAAMKGNPWKKSNKGYCTQDTQSDCNMPTLWLSVSFRDAIKVSAAKLPRFKNSAFSQAGVDVSPRIVRKHGGKLPFQLKSVNGVQWQYFKQHNIYAKKFTAGLESKLDLWKLGHVFGKQSLSKTHRPEFSLKTTPLSGSFLVEVAAKDTSDLAEWLTGDITSSIAGCSLGFAIGILAETDPVTFCHSISYLSELVESALQGIDEHPSMFLEADASVTIPTSIEYKYATTGSQLIGIDPHSYEMGRTQYHNDSELTTWFTDETKTSNQSFRHPQITKIKQKAQRIFSKLASTPLSPISVFRARVGFNYSETMLKKGKYPLPSVIVVD